MIGHRSLFRGWNSYDNCSLHTIGSNRHTYLDTGGIFRAALVVVPTIKAKPILTVTAKEGFDNFIALRHSNTASLQTCRCWSPNFGPLLRHLCNDGEPRLIKGAPWFFKCREFSQLAFRQNYEVILTWFYRLGRVQNIPRHLPSFLFVAGLYKTKQKILYLLKQSMSSKVLSTKLPSAGEGPSPPRPGLSPALRSKSTFHSPLFISPLSLRSTFRGSHLPRDLRRRPPPDLPSLDV